MLSRTLPPLGGARRPSRRPHRSTDALSPRAGIEKQGGRPVSKLRSLASRFPARHQHASPEVGRAYRRCIVQFPPQLAGTSFDFLLFSPHRPMGTYRASCAMGTYRALWRNGDVPRPTGARAQVGFNHRVASLHPTQAAWKRRTRTGRVTSPWHRPHGTRGPVRPPGTVDAVRPHGSVRPRLALWAGVYFPGVVPAASSENLAVHTSRSGRATRPSRVSRDDPLNAPARQCGGVFSVLRQLPAGIHSWPSPRLPSSWICLGTLPSVGDHS